MGSKAETQGSPPSLPAGGTPRAGIWTGNLGVPEALLSNANSLSRVGWCRVAAVTNPDKIHVYRICGDVSVAKVSPSGEALRTVPFGKSGEAAKIRPLPQGKDPRQTVVMVAETAPDPAGHGLQPSRCAASIPLWRRGGAGTRGPDGPC